MHYFAGVVIQRDDDVEDAVAKAMEPHKEWYSDDEDGEYGGIWDWYQIGGRYTGRWSDYKPELDPKNIETCFLCHGSGLRNDELGRQVRAENPDYTCNGCDGKGAAVTWPTKWRAHEGDVQPVSAVIDRIRSMDADAWQAPFSLLLPDAPPLHREAWDGEHWTETKPEAEWPAFVADALEPYRDAALVVVDYHS